MEAHEAELVAKVRDLARANFASRAEHSDRTGEFAHESIRELQELGIPGMGLAKSYGGLGLGAEAHLRIIEEIAYFDASVAVALNMHLLVADVLATIPMFARGTAVLEDIAKNGVLLCAPGSIPSGELDNRKAGYEMVEDDENLRVNGRSGFASGSDGAKYVFLGGRIDRGEGNEPDLVLCMPEKTTPGLTMHNNWDAMGLRGTASHDISAENAVVPKSEAAIIPAMILRALLQSGQGAGGVQQNRARGALGILAIWLGASQAAFDYTVDYVGKRHGYLAGEGNPALGRTPGFRADEAWAQVDMGHLDHWVGTGRVVFYDMVRRLGDEYPNAQEFTRDVTRTVYHMRRMSEDVALGVMKVCGAHGYVKARPLERIVRDLIGGNVMAWKTDQLAMTLGQGALGMPITIAGPAGA